MPDSPVTAKFLDEEDKLVAIERYITLLPLSINIPTHARPAGCA
jgi:hypothetical protein